jgi:hypothetical protein
MQQGVPRSLNISDDLPPSIRAYRRQSVHLNTTQNAFGPGSVAIIPIDTGTEGVFVDTRTIRLVFDVRFINRCRYIDFVNLGRAGAAAFIEEIAFEINGVPIESNTQYAATTELEKIRRGEAADPFMMTFENPYEPLGSNARQGHINLMKPCMVDANGHSWDFYAINAPIVSATPLANATFLGSNSATTLDTGVLEHRYLADWAYGNLDNLSSNGGGVRVNPQGTRTSVLAGAAYGPPETVQCDFIRLKEMVQAQRRGRRDLKNVYAEGANMKLIPVHHRPANPEWTKAVNFVAWNTTSSPTACAMDDVRGTSHTYQFSLELYMGLFGRMNTKWIPTLAIGAGRAQLRLKFARPQQAFDVAMDPCRRIPGTMRDTCTNSYGVDSRTPTTHAGIRSAAGFESDPSCVLYDALVAKAAQTSTSPYFLRLSDSRAVAITETNGDRLLSAALVPCLGVANGTFPNITVFGQNYTVFDQSASAWSDAEGDTALAALAGNFLPYNAEATTGTLETAEPIARGRFSVHAAPACQYMLAKKPSLGRNGTASDFVTETYLCYGTHHSRSKAQSRRTHLGALPLDLPAIDYNNSITYEISNLLVRATEILFSDEITDSLLSAGVAGNAVMETTIFRETKVQLHQNGSQKILIPLTGASIQDICVAFRHQEQLWGVQALSQPTYGFIDPFTSVNFISDVTKAKGFSGLNVQSAWSGANHLGINMCFQLGSEFLPRVPIDDITGFIDFVCQGDQIFYGAGELGDYRRMNQNPERMDIFSEWTASASGLSETARINHFDPGFFTTFMDVRLLDDQTVTANPFLYLFASAANRPGRLVDEQLLPYLQPSVGTFHISLNLETMMGHGHKTRSGSTIVNNQLYLKMDRVYGCAASALEMIAYARCNAKVVFERGGSVQIIS